MRNHTAGFTFLFAVLLVVALPVTIVAADSNTERERAEVAVVDDWGENAPDVTTGDAEAGVAWVANTNAATTWLYGVHLAEVARQEAAAAAAAAASAPRRSSGPTGSSGVGGACGGSKYDYVIDDESGGDPGVYNGSGSGAWGCYQIMPGTWSGAGCNELGAHGSASVEAQAACADRLSPGAWSASQG